MSQPTQEPIHVILYTKPGCHLCDEARILIEDWAAEADRWEALVIDEIDIRRDPVLFERYRYRIPVIVVDGREVAEGRIDDVTALMPVF